MKILIADDHAVVRRGIREILEEALPEVSIDETDSASETVKAVMEKAYDIVLLDISFPDSNGLDVLRKIRAFKAKTRLLMLSVYPEEQYAVRALRAGAYGYLTKDSTSIELVAAIRVVAAGGKYITQALAERLIDEINMDISKPLHAALSGREYQIMNLLLDDKSIGEIAEELSLSPKTISTYCVRIKKKLRVKTTAGIIRYALENRLDH